MADDISDLKGFARKEAEIKNKKINANKPNPTVKEQLDYIIALLEK